MGDLSLQRLVHDLGHHDPRSLQSGRLLITISQARLACPNLHRATT